MDRRRKNSQAKSRSQTEIIWKFRKAWQGCDEWYFGCFFVWLLVKIVKSQRASRQMSFSSMCLLSVAAQKLCNRFFPLHHSRCRGEFPLRNLLYPEDGENTGSIVRWEHFGEWTTVNLPYFVTNRERKRTNQGKKREAYERFDDKHHAKCAKPLIKR